MGDAAKRMQQGNSAPGKAGRRPQAGRQRQLEHEVCAAARGGLGALVFFKNSKAAALDVISAHSADNGGFRTQETAGFRKMPGMAVVKGIVFCDDPTNFHGSSEKLVNISCANRVFRVQYVCVYCYCTLFCGVLQFHPQNPAKNLKC